MMGTGISMRSQMRFMREVCTALQKSMVVLTSHSSFLADNAYEFPFFCEAIPHA